MFSDITYVTKHIVCLFFCWAGWQAVDKKNEFYYTNIYQAVRKMSLLECREAEK